MANVKSYKDLFNGSLRLTLKKGAELLSRYPESERALIKVMKNLKASDKKRAKLLKEGIEAPPLAIISATNECNLKCKGCYSCELKNGNKSGLSDLRKAGLLNEAASLGVSIVMLAGGEPLLAGAWLEQLSAHPELLGIVFTNGTLLDKNRIGWFGRNRHIIPALSIEGYEPQTDERRGKGVHKLVEAGMAALKEAGIPFAVSITATSENIDMICSGLFIRSYIEKGCRLFFYVEYVPVAKGTEPLVLSAAGKKRLNAFCTENAKRNAAAFIPFPGDEDKFGGCLAAGRGFVHISADGALEPCPFAPFSDMNLSDMSLKEALSSELLKKIRQNHHLLKEGEGGCALWSNRTLFFE